MKIAFGIAIAIAITFFYYAYRMSLQNIELKAVILKQYTNLNTDNKIAEESFLKFLSDSREWAFEYIEEVQAALNKFDEAIKKDIEYFDQYGDILGETRPDYILLKNISDSYKELQKMMPKEKE